MGQLKTLSDKKVRRWPYYDDGKWKLDRVVKTQKKRIGSNPKGNGYSEYVDKYGDMEVAQFDRIAVMSRKDRRRWCLGLRKYYANKKRTA